MSVTIRLVDSLGFMLKLCHQHAETKRVLESRCLSPETCDLHLKNVPISHQDDDPPQLARHMGEAALSAYFGTC